MGRQVSGVTEVFAARTSSRHDAERRPPAVVSGGESRDLESGELGFGLSGEQREVTVA